MAHLSSHEADINYLVRQSMNTGYQWMSLLVPPAYVCYVVARRGRANLSINRVLRATWVGGLSGAVVAGGASYVRYASSNQESVKIKRLERAYNTDTLRRNDHSTIGGILMAVLTPALLWKRANIVNLVLGGAGIGGGLGILVHYGRSITGDTPPGLDVIPVSSESNDTLLS